MAHIIVINPGSTSTKIAYYEDEKQLWKENISYSAETVKAFRSPYDQLPMRLADIEKVLEEKGIGPEDIDCAVARGGLVPHASAGAIEVTDELVRVLREEPVDLHISNIGAQVAQTLARKAGVKAYIYDPVTVDEMIDVVRITGLREIRRWGQGHNLNMRAAALAACRNDESLSYKDNTLIVVHLGGGITLSLHHKGRIIDMVSDEDGPFAPERAGNMPSFKWTKLIFDKGWTREQALRKIQREGGLVDFFGTSDLREVEKMIDEGSEEAALVFEAMALNVAKCIGKLAVVVSGKIDRIILTGGGAYSERLVSGIKKYAGFFAPFTIIPGENELDALAGGALRVLRGEENAKIFTK